MLIRKPDLRSEVATLEKSVLDKSDFARIWRNKRLAHSDLTIYRHPAHSLQINREQVEDALEAMRNLLNHVARHYGLSGVNYTWVIEPTGGVDQLFRHLERSVNAKAGK